MESKSYEKVPLSNTQMKTFRDRFENTFLINPSCQYLKHLGLLVSPKCNFWREDSFWITKENISPKTITSMSTSKKFLIKKLKHLEGEKWNGRFKNLNICTRNVTKIQKNVHLKGPENYYTYLLQSRPQTATLIVNL